jgi:isochorismate pyruvate lyase
MADRSSQAKAPASCTDMTELRAEIDRLDRQIVALLAERSGYVARAAEIKQMRAAVVDEARIEQVVARARTEAASHGADAALIEAIYRAMIAAFIAYEERAFDRK